MTKSAEQPRYAGARFLRLARLLYPEPTVTAVFAPAIADLQEELAAAGSSPLRRVMTRCRWYCALLALAVVVALTLPGTRTPYASSPLSTRRSGGWLLVVLAAALYGGTWQFFGWFVAAALPMGAALAIAMRRWHNRHPQLLASSDRARSRDPEINLSAIPVGGDVAGLLFAVGSVVIVLVGLPTLWWFVAAAATGSLFVALARHHAAGAPGPNRSATSIRPR